MKPKISYFLLLLFALLLHSSNGQEDRLRELLQSKVIEPLQTSYDALPPNGKFATGAFVGFTVSRTVVSAATKIIKIVGIAYIGCMIVNHSFFRHNEPNPEVIINLKTPNIHLSTIIIPPQTKQQHRSEALNYAGLLSTDDWSAQNKILGQIQYKMKKTLNESRVFIRRHLHPSNIKSFVDGAMRRDRMATTGFATGAVFGLLV